MEKSTPKKYDYFAIAVFLVILYLDNRHSSITRTFLSLDYFITMVINLIIVYVVGLPLSFFMAKSHIVSAQYFWRWANVLAFLVMLLMLKGATQ